MSHEFKPLGFEPDTASVFSDVSWNYGNTRRLPEWNQYDDPDAAKIMESFPVPPAVPDKSSARSSSQSQDNNYIYTNQQSSINRLSNTSDSLSPPRIESSSSRARSPYGHQGYQETHVPSDTSSLYSRKQRDSHGSSLYAPPSEGKILELRYTNVKRTVDSLKEQGHNSLTEGRLSEAERIFTEVVNKIFKVDENLQKLFSHEVIEARAALGLAQGRLNKFEVARDTFETTIYNIQDAQKENQEKEGISTDADQKPQRIWLQAKDLMCRQGLIDVLVELQDLDKADIICESTLELIQLYHGTTHETYVPVLRKRIAILHKLERPYEARVLEDLLVTGYQAPVNTSVTAQLRKPVRSQLPGSRISDNSIPSTRPMTTVLATDEPPQRTITRIEVQNKNMSLRQQREHRKGWRQALESGAINDVMHYIRIGLDLNRPLDPSPFDFPILIAARKHQAAIVSLLLDNFADANKLESDMKKTVLHHLVAGPDDCGDVIAKLYQRRFNLDWSKCNKSDVPVHKACSNGHYKILKVMFQHGATTGLRDEFENEPLHIASAAGYPDIVKFLVDKGAFLNSQNKDGSTPLMLACKNNSPSVVQFLFERGANAHLVDSQKNSPVQVATVFGFRDIVAFFIQNHIEDINRSDDQGQSLLHIAVKHDHASIVKLLVSLYATLDSQDMSGETPLFTACKLGRLVITEILLSAGASIYIPDREGTTPFHVSIRSGHYKIQEVLLSEGASIHEADKNGTTPLHTACRLGMLKTVQTLVINGASVISKDSRGWTSLHSASEFGALEIVQFLLQNGSRDVINDKDMEGFTAFARAGTKPVQNLLRENGAEFLTWKQTYKVGLAHWKSLKKDL